MFMLATVQARITRDVRANGAHMRAAMTKAAEAGAQLAHFPEACLSGYVKSEIEDWAEVDWRLLASEREAIAAHAARLGLWTVYGANHPLPGRRPQNAMHVVGPDGSLVGRYAKRMLSNTELTYYYTPGTTPLVFEAGGLRFGCALCIEVVFPQLFAEYERLGVQCMLLGTYGCDPIHGVMARAHAATNCLWLSLASPAQCSPTLPCALFGPDGHPIGAARPGTSGLLLNTLDPDDPRYNAALHAARPWRAHARDAAPSLRYA